MKLNADNLEKSRTLIEIIPNFIEDVEFFINKFKEKAANGFFIYI